VGPFHAVPPPEAFARPVAPWHAAAQPASKAPPEAVPAPKAPLPVEPTCDRLPVAPDKRDVKPDLTPEHERVSSAIPVDEVRPAAAVDEAQVAPEADTNPVDTEPSATEQQGTVAVAEPKAAAKSGLKRRKRPAGEDRKKRMYRYRTVICFLKDQLAKYEQKLADAEAESSDE